MQLLWYPLRKPKFERRSIDYVQLLSDPCHSYACRGMYGDMTRSTNLLAIHDRVCESASDLPTLGSHMMRSEDRDAETRST